jgi:hypothetical protein
MEQLKANELRIGNLIMSGNNGLFDTDGAIGKVLEIGNIEREFEQIYCECEESFDWFFKDNYFGIPLTEEWLEKFGFKKEKGESYKLGKYQLYYLLYYEGYKVGELTIKYVHQLQNIYFASSGEELTIKEL